MLGRYILCIIYYLAASQAAVSEPSLGSGVVAIQSGEYRVVGEFEGSGYHIGDNWYITAKHVLDRIKENNQKFYVTLASKKWDTNDFEVKGHKCDEELFGDICFFRLDAADGRLSNPNINKKFDIVCTYSRREKIEVLGFTGPGDGIEIISDESITQVKARFVLSSGLELPAAFTTTAQTSDGNSGGPVVRSGTRQVIGMHSGFSDDDQKQVVQPLGSISDVTIEGVKREICKNGSALPSAPQDQFDSIYFMFFVDGAVSSDPGKMELIAQAISAANSIISKVFGDHDLDIDFFASPDDDRFEVIFPDSNHRRELVTGDFREIDPGNSLIVRARVGEVGSVTFDFSILYKNHDGIQQLSIPNYTWENLANRNGLAWHLLREMEKRGAIYLQPKIAAIDCLYLYRGRDEYEDWSELSEAIQLALESDLSDIQWRNLDHTTCIIEGYTRGPRGTRDRMLEDVSQGGGDIPTFLLAAGIRYSEATNTVRIKPFAGRPWTDLTKLRGKPIQVPLTDVDHDELARSINQHFLDRIRNRLGVE